MCAVHLSFIAEPNLDDMQTIDRSLTRALQIHIEVVYRN